MINVGEIIFDPDFCQNFVVQRKVGEWADGRFVESTGSFNFTGIIIPASAQEINQAPEGDRVTGMMKFYSVNEVYTTNEYGTSDIVVWRGKSYRIINVTPFVDYGYFLAFGVYMESV